MAGPRAQGEWVHFLEFFKHSPSQKEIDDPELVNKQYRYWRWRIFYSMYIGYAFFYLTRKSFTFAMPAMKASLGFTNVELGILITILYVSYGASKFVSGVISDSCNPRYFMSIGLILTGVLNIFFGLSSSMFFFALFVGLNGWFQGWGWPPCARALVHWYGQKERGTWWAIWSTSHNVGGALIAALGTFLAQHWGWQVAVYVPGVLCIMFGLVLLNRLRDTPQSLGLPPIEKFGAGEGFEENSPGEGFVSEGKEQSQREILVNFVFKNRYIWTLGIAYFFVYVIRTAMNDWSVMFLQEFKGFSLVSAGACIVSFEAGGLFGSLGAGWFSDRLFGGRRGPVNVLFSLAVIFALGLFWYTPFGNFVFASALMFLIGFFIFGPQMLMGLAAAELSHKKAAGTATGFIGWFAYSGAAAAGFPIGKITQDYGWGSFFVVLIGCGVISLALLLPLWSVKDRKKRVASVAKSAT